MAERDEQLIEQQIAFYDQLVLGDPEVYGDLPEGDLVRFALKDCPEVESCLELGSGTGRWTEHLLKLAYRITAIDTSADAHAMSMKRLRQPRVSYRLADIFRYEDDDTYDLIFGGFWLTHVPESRFEPFWDLLRRLLKPHGQVIFVDSQESGPGGGGSLRRLPDGREYEIVKVKHDLSGLEDRLRRLGWRASVDSMTDNIYRVAAKPLPGEAAGR
jgi:SAM-dependent methyltransferase